MEHLDSAILASRIVAVAVLPIEWGRPGGEQAVWVGVARARTVSVRTQTTPPQERHNDKTMPSSIITYVPLQKKKPKTDF